MTDRLVGWAKAHQKITSWTGAILLVGAGLFVWTLSTQLGAAYEDMGQARQAGEAYENGSAAARLDFLKAQMLSDAGRAWTSAGDTTRAVADYRRILTEFAKEGMAAEAKVRLSELTKGTVS